MAKSERSKKSKVLTSVAAVVLAASMLIGGGTYAYLQGETNDVVNMFNANQVTVDLEESTGNDYEIIPGTTQDKDPKVTVNATVPAYVFVTVEDATDGLVDYAIADGWTKLDGYDNVYYREVAASDTEQEFYVLAGNKVSYDAALANSDMVDEEGNLKEGLELTFKAYAIQKDPFASAVDAWEGKDTEIVSNEEEFITAVKNGGTVMLAEDIVFTTDTYITDVNTTIDLNGKTVTFDGAGLIELTGTAKVTVTGGTMDLLETSNLGFLFRLSDDSELTILDGEYNTGLTAVQIDNNAVCNIYGGTFTALASWNGQYWILNKMDNTKATTDFNVYGGSFLNFDPSNAVCENPVENWVAEGYDVESEVQANGDTWYTVVKAD